MKIIPVRTLAKEAADLNARFEDLTRSADAGTLLAEAFTRKAEALIRRISVLPPGMPASPEICVEKFLLDAENEAIQKLTREHVERLKALKAERSRLLSKIKRIKKAAPHLFEASAPPAVTETLH